MGDYRPINLLGSMYTVLIEVLAAKMRKVLEAVISTYQNAFGKGHQILNCSFIANEVPESRIKEGRGGMLFKVDMMKAYGHVSWNT